MYHYNPTTARHYTDLSLLTADMQMTAGVHDIFNFLTSYSEQPNYGPLLVSPRLRAPACGLPGGT